jgi:multiple sugar transport system substrate-binding protein
VNAAQRPSVNRRSFLSLVAGAGLALPAAGLLAGCGGGGGGALGDNAGEGGGAGGSGSAAPGGGSGGTVTELVVPTAESPWLDSYKKIVEDYQKQSGVTVTLKTFPMAGLLTQQANAIQHQSNAFDIFQINERWVGQFYANGWVQPLKDIDASFAWDPALMRFDGVGQWDAAKQVTSNDGEVLALPMNGNILLFVYRKDLYDQLGLQVPKNWDDVVANGKKAKQQGAVENGYVLRGKTPTFDFESVLYSYGGKWFADEGTDWTPAIASPQAEQALSVFVEMAKIGPAQPQTVAQAEAVSLMQAGETLQACLVVAASAPLEDPNASLTAGKLGYAMTPAGSKGQTPCSGTWTMGVPTGLPADRAKAAYDFITWLMGKNAMQAWTGYGGVPTRTDSLTPDIASERPDLQAMIDSDQYIHGCYRYPFQADMLPITERHIGEAVAGSVSVKDTLAAIAKDVGKVVSDYQKEHS